MGEPRSVSVRYNEAVESFVALARTLTADDWATHVPCTPGWTVRNVLSHVSGIPDDALAGRLDGTATEPWTASQVERNAEFSVGDLLARWESQYQTFGSVIEAMGERRPPIDCHTHEHDVRQALGRPGNRSSAIIEDVDELLIGLVDVPVEIAVQFDDRSSITAGQLGSTSQVALTTTRFEVFRSRLGRRSAAQLRALDWKGDSDAVDVVLAAWFNFGPSSLPIVE
jgi:uncharacterized protein (TIGR03083 family)